MINLKKILISSLILLGLPLVTLAVALQQNQGGTSTTTVFTTNQIIYQGATSYGAATLGTGLTLNAGVLSASGGISSSSVSTLILPLKANGTVAGVNATSSTVSFNVQGTGTLNPFNVASSSGVSYLTVANNGSTTISTLATGIVQSNSGSLYTLPLNTYQPAGSYVTNSYASSSYFTLWNTQAGSNITINTSSNPTIAVVASPTFTNGIFNGTLAVTGSTTLSSLTSGCVNSTSGGALYVTTCASGGTNYWTNSGNAIFNNTGYQVGINSSTPIANLVVQGSSTAPTIPVLTVSSSSSVSLFTILPNGNIGISSATPGSTLSFGKATTSVTTISTSGASVFSSNGETFLSGLGTASMWFLTNSIPGLGRSGDIQFQTGSPTTGNSNAGGIFISGGQGKGTGNGGSFSMSGGSRDPLMSVGGGNGGSFSLIAGSGNTGGSIFMSSGSSDTGDGGGYDLETAPTDGAGHGGDILFGLQSGTSRGGQFQIESEFGTFNTVAFDLTLAPGFFVTDTYQFPGDTGIFTVGTGTNGRSAYWTDAYNLTSSASLLNNGTVVGVNATSSTVNLLVQGTGILNPFRVTSSTGASLLTIGTNGTTTISSLNVASWVCSTSSGQLYNGCAITTLGQITSYNGLITQGQGISPIVMENDILATTTAATVGTYTATATSTIEASGYTNITAISVDVLNFRLTWTDENGISQSQNFFPMGLTSANLSTTGYNAFPSATIRVVANTQVKLAVVFTTGIGSVTYDVGGWIKVLK